MTNNWQFHNVNRKKGRSIALLSMNELTLALPILRKRTTVQYIHNHKEYFHRHDPKFFEQNLAQAKERMSLLLYKYRKSSSFDDDVLTLLNMDLQQTFSDLGWVSFRREFSQLKKRQKKSRPEISNHVMSALRQQMEQSGWKSFDEAITALLIQYNPDTQINTSIEAESQPIIGELKNHWVRVYGVEYRDGVKPIEIKAIASAESLLHALITSLLNSDFIEYAIFGSEQVYGYKKLLLRVIKGKRIYLKTTIQGRQKIIGQHVALDLLSHIELN